MAIYKRDIVDINLETGNIHRSFLNHTIGYKDQQADHFGIRTFRNGEPVDLTGVSVQGVFMPPQGSPIAITSGNIVDGNVAEVVLPQACYNYNGNFTLAIKLVDGTNSITGTMRIVDGVVDNTHASGTVAPTSAVPTYQEILSTYDAMVAATAAANGAIAPLYANLTFPVKAGQYTIVDGALKRAIVYIATSEVYTAAHWTNAKLGPDLCDLKSALSYSGLDILDNKIYTITHSGMCFNSSGTGYMHIDINSPTTNPAWNAYLIPCTEGDIFIVFSVGGTTTYAYAFIDSNGDILSNSSSNYTADGKKITAPANTAYLVVNDKGGASRVYKGELYKNRIQRNFTEVYNTIKTNSKNCIFYVGNGTKVSWSGYNESPITLSLGTNNYIIIIDNTNYTILLSDIITAATSAGVTVDQSNKKLTDVSFLLYFDIETHTPKVINSMTSPAARTAISNNPVLFAAHYKSFRGGLLVDYMQEQRIESAEGAIEGLETEVNAIKEVSADVVPSYFESNLSAKIPEIIANMNEAGQNGTSFVFITDLHWETNYRNSPSLVKRVLDKTSVKNVFSGGDIINQGEKAEMAEVFLDCINHFRFVPNLGFFPIARGNHDDNSNWSSSADVTAYAFDANTIYNLYYSQFADKVTRIGSNWAFYFDQDVIKTRYIFVDTKRNGLTIDYQAIIDCLNTVGSGWHVVFLMHFTLRNATTLFAGCDLVAHIVKAYNNRENGSYASGYQTATYDFTNAVGKVDLIIGGHMHSDYAMNANDANNPSGIPIIATDTDSYRDHSGTEGTVNSQCFDVVTVDYSNRTVKCVRIGRGSDRSFTY